MPLPRPIGSTLVLLGLVLAALPGRLAGQAQATTGVIRGTVRDSAGGTLAGASVTLRNAETNAERVLSTNERGVYVATLLRVGTYDVTARALGFQEAKRSGLVLRLGETLDLPFSLKPQAVQLQEITVSAGEPAVDATTSESSTRLGVEAVEGLPNNGRNIFNFTTLTPNVAIVQGPDGDEISIGGQKGIHNNVSVDGADFNNPFFGEQRGGQRPAFTFNLDAVQDFVVVADGANAEFGRSSGGFINVITKSGTNEFHGSAHYFGKYDQLSADFSHSSPGGVSGFTPDFAQHQFGATLGGPLVRDKAFFFLAYDQQEYNETKQTDRLGQIDPALQNFVNTATFGGTAPPLAGDFGPISRTNDANALLGKLDFRLSQKHSASLKYNYTRSSQQNGTFDVDFWGRSANGLENDHSHAVNGSLTSLFSSSLSNEFRFQWAREDRPRPYEGPINPATGRPFPDTDIGFLGPDGFSGYRIGMPFFIPVDAHDYRLQFLDNVSILRGNHLFKIGAEWNRTGVNQTFRGFGNGRIAFTSVDGFLNYVANGNGYVECADSSNAATPSQTTGDCPAGQHITGPVALYLQQAGIGGLSVDEAGTQTIIQNELAVFLQDSWKPRSNLTLNYGLRWEAQIQPGLITPKADLFYAPLIGKQVINSVGTFDFPGDGTIPSDYAMFQPRLGLAYDVKGDGKQVVRANAGIYYARIPGLNLASSRSTDGSRGQSIFRASFLTPVPGVGGPPDYGELLPEPTGAPIAPGVFVFDKDFENPRTFTATLGYEREVASGLAAGVSYTHARTDHLTRFLNANDTVFGSPWATGLDGGNGISTLTVVQSTAKSRYNGVTAELRRTAGSRLQFQLNYTLSWDKADDDNERDPFTFRYVRPDSLDAEYGYSDRDQRHRFNAWVLAILPGDFYLNNRLSAYSAQPASESCGADNQGTGTRVASSSVLRICPDGHILRRNTTRRDNAYFSWDIRLSRPFNFARQGTFEAIFEVFNVTNADNFKDPSSGGTFLNFDGTIRSGLGEPRQFQVGGRWLF
jgi:hypothetical protein